MPTLASLAHPLLEPRTLGARPCRVSILEELWHNPAESSGNTRFLPSPPQVVSRRYTSGGSPDSLPHNSSSHQLPAQRPLKCLEASWLSDALTFPQSLFLGGPLSQLSHLPHFSRFLLALFFSDPPPPLFCVRQDPHGGLLVPHPLSPFNPSSAPRASTSTSLQATLTDFQHPCLSSISNCCLDSPHMIHSQHLRNT